MESGGCEMNTTTKTKAIMPATTRSQGRVQLYQPTQRPTRRAGSWQESSWGRVRVTGRLGQRHADLVESICACAIARREIADGGLELLVDPHKVRRVLAGGHGQYSAEQMTVLLADLRAVVVELETPAMRGERAIGGLVDHWLPDGGAVRDPLTGQTRQLWRVRLGALLVELLRHDAAIWRDPAPIAALQSGAAQAVARHVLTHQSQPQGGWRLDGLLDAVGVPASGTARRNARRGVRGAAAGLARLGIMIDGERVVTSKTAGDSA